MIAIAIAQIQCPNEVCLGHLEQGEYDLRPRCNTCLREYDIVEADERTNAKEAKTLREQVDELQGKLDEISSIARW